jgi:DNA ligase-1
MIPENFKPLLAATVDLKKVKYPCFISPKLDGIRVLGMNGKAMTRSMKELPNRYIQSVFASGLYDGLDGEIIVGPPNAPDVYRVTNSAVMSRDGEPNFTYHVFDRWDLQYVTFDTRYKNLEVLCCPPKAYALHRVGLVPQVKVHDLAGIHDAEAHWLSEGYEGVMGRSIDGVYKYGRATMKEGILWKLKRFADHEYEVIGFEELMHNENEATVDELGHTKRSSHMENKRGGGVLGALVLRHPEAGEFRCGTGFTAADRAEIWTNRSGYLGRMAKIKHFEIGVKDLPRFPVFLGFRAQEDM